jgi:DNA repair exonuclease SbcCD ATPase subunit
MSKPIFRIESLRIKGPGKEPAVVDFKPGINFIIGPSNTGKSLIVDAIDYAFGYQPKKNNNHYRLGIATDNGYEELTLSLATENGLVNLTRKFGDTKIRVDATDPDFESGTYSISANEYVARVEHGASLALYTSVAKTGHARRARCTLTRGAAVGQ